MRTLFIEELDGETISAYEWHHLMREDRAEYEAEMAAERYFENRGYWEARAQEDYEARMGIFA